MASSACLTQELSSKLCEHLERDAIALLVTASDHVHQNQGARVLLRHSFHPVQTYAVRSAVLAGH
ncbi:hypothetical protein EGT07_36895 [Herbaspirillum sp. HC18]|nr:hypothetical protein EGT07_36895 [Herbaspirillum sp. HC18]